MKKKYVKEISCCRDCEFAGYGYTWIRGQGRMTCVCKKGDFEIDLHQVDINNGFDPGCPLPNVEEIPVDKDALEYVDRCKVPIKIMKEYPHQAVVTANEAKRALRIQRENFEKRVKDVLDEVIYGPYPVPQKKIEILKQLGIEEEKK